VTTTHLSIAGRSDHGAAACQLCDASCMHMQQDETAPHGRPTAPSFQTGLVLYVDRDDDVRSFPEASSPDGLLAIHPLHLSPPRQIPFLGFRKTTATNCTNPNGHARKTLACAACTPPLPRHRGMVAVFCALDGGGMWPPFSRSPSSKGAAPFAPYNLCHVRTAGSI
jgi:hypothetical protein